MADTTPHRIAPASADARVVVVDSDRLDGSSAPAVREQLRAAIEAWSGDVVVDLTTVQWVDVTGLGVLVAANRQLRGRRRRLVLRGCLPRVRRALAVTRLNRFLELEPPLGML